MNCRIENKGFKVVDWIDYLGSQVIVHGDRFVGGEWSGVREFWC